MITKEDNSGIKTMKSDFLKVLENNRDGVIITDKEGIVQFVNSAAEKLFCRDRKMFLGHMFGNPVVSGKVTEITVPLKGGKTIIAEVTVLEILWENENAFLLAFHDITERKKTEQELKNKNEELEKFNKIAVGRELKMIKLKNQIKELNAKISRTKN